jgi:DNA processing protein
MDGTRGRLALLLTRGITDPDWVRLEALERDEGLALEDDGDLGRLCTLLGRTVGPVDWRERDHQLAAMERARARLVCRWEDPYPEALRAIAQAPPALFVRGRAESLGGLCVGVVGTRKPSPAGSAFARRLAREAASLGLAVVSGLARGIDTEAHRGAMEAQGTTVAVLGTGVDVVYPPENGELMAQIAEVGAVVSEQTCGTPARAHVFPRRNRIISGLCDAVVVVEGGARSGALITARWALDQGREVGAVPGFPGDFRSAGPNRLLREGAFLVEDARDVIANVPRLARALSDVAAARAHTATAAAGLDGSAARVYDLVARGASVDEVARASGLEVAEVARVLVTLEIEGRVERDNLGRYFRASHDARARLP